MGIRLYSEPELKDPVMFCGWPGIGNIGIIAIDTLRMVSHAEEFGEIEPWEFFDPYKVVIRNGLLKELLFPSNKFCFRKLDGRDLLFFIGEQQPAELGRRYAEGQKAYQMANLVLDVAQRFGCRRIYTSGAAVTQIHHTAGSRVWAVPNSEKLIPEVKGYENTILMSETEGRGEQGVITGLNGLLLGVAKKRGLEAVCVMGEIPYYLEGAPWPYPKASKSVLEVLANVIGIKVDLNRLDELTVKVEEQIENFLDALFRNEAIPTQFKEEIERLKDAERTRLGPITEDEKKKMMEHIDELFNQGGWKDEKSV